MSNTPIGTGVPLLLSLSGVIARKHMYVYLHITSIFFSLCIKNYEFTVVLSIYNKSSVGSSLSALK